MSQPEATFKHELPLTMHDTEHAGMHFILSGFRICSFHFQNTNLTSGEQIL